MDTVILAFIEYNDSYQEFEKAINNNHFSRNENAINYVGNFMYMGTKIVIMTNKTKTIKETTIQWKHGITRDYHNQKFTQEIHLLEDFF